MGLLDLFSKAGRGERHRGRSDVDARYLANWVHSHVGVEAYVEPQTTVTPMTVVLVANDGEWTRRAVGGERGARKLGEDLSIPVYDVRKTGYPQRMRDHDARQKILRNRAREA
ncbi:oxidoreductase [Rhodococcus sp. NPDC127528]|uniref:oxidoreductase n=1 Tax=unclassified Rhodococcus (in: high G+C Gram-positive bacteria) TaxID=192944 RepID=UPI00362BEF2B